MTSANVGNGEWSTVINGSLAGGALTSTVVELWGAAAAEFLCTYTKGTETNCTFIIESWDKQEGIWRRRFVSSTHTGNIAERYLTEPMDIEEDRIRIRAVPNAAGTGTVKVLCQVDSTRIHAVS